MPPKPSSRQSTPRATTPLRSGLRSQTPTGQPAAAPAANDPQRELPDLQTRASNAYGGPSRAEIARATRATTGAENVAHAFETALTGALQRTGGASVETDEEGDAALPRRSTRRASLARSDSEDLSDAGSVRSSVSGRSTSRVTRHSRAQAATAMPSIAEVGSSPATNTLHTTGNDTTRVDNSLAGGFRTPSRPGSALGFAASSSPSSMASQPSPPRARPNASRPSRDSTTSQVAGPPKGFAPDQAAAHAQKLAPNQAARPTNDRAPLQNRIGRPYINPKNILVTMAIAFILAVCAALCNPTLFTVPHRPSAWDVAIPTEDFPSDGSFAHVKVNSRLSTLETQMAMVIKKLNLHSETVAQIESMIPEKIHVYRNKDGELKISDAFWKAIEGKMGRGNSEAWDKFLKHNYEKVNEYLDARTNLKYDKNHIAWKEENSVIGPAAFIAMLNDNFGEFKDEIRRKHADYDAKLEKLEQSIDEKTEKGIDKALGLPSFQLTAIAIANMAKNIETQLKKVNFFAPSLGAVINPFESSPTATSSAINLPHRSFFSVFRGYVPNPHIMALEPWSEPRDCWCAAPQSDPAHFASRSPEAADGGTFEEGWTIGADLDERVAALPRAQLSILLPQAIYPNEVTVEHFPAAGNLDSSSMPKDLELYVQVVDPADRENLVFESLFSLRRNLESLRTRVKTGAATDLDDSWVKVADFSYDRDAPNHIQTFPVTVSARKHGIGIRKVAIRATANHGGDVTCLYRVRVHGEVAAAPEEGPE